MPRAPVSVGVDRGLFQVAYGLMRQAVVGPGAAGRGRPLFALAKESSALAQLLASRERIAGGAASLGEKLPLAAVRARSV